MEQDLQTEAVNPASADIDVVSTADMLRIINEADQEIAAAVAKTIPAIAIAVDATAERLQAGGRLFYVGAGTSGRLGVLDASECPPTFNTPPALVQALIAGGDRALREAAEGAEDNALQGQMDLEAEGFSAGDVLVGIAASGRTPYVLGAVSYARSLGAFTVGLSCTPGSRLAEQAELAITPVPGPEVITGSTRMRAGTATKLVLNMISTGVMVRMGYVYGNLMVNVKMSNHKLADRARRIVSAVAHVSIDRAAELLAESGSVRSAILMHERNITPEQAEARLGAASGSLRKALSDCEAMGHES